MNEWNLVQSQRTKTRISSNLLLRTVASTSFAERTQKKPPASMPGAFSIEQLLLAAAAVSAAATGGFAVGLAAAAATGGFTVGGSARASRFAVGLRRGATAAVGFVVVTVVSQVAGSGEPAGLQALLSTTLGSCAGVSRGGHSESDHQQGGGEEHMHFLHVSLQKM